MMTTPKKRGPRVDEAVPAVATLVEDQFGPRALAALLGSEGAAVPLRLWERALLGPARDFLSRPGKQFRAALVEAGWALGGGEGVLPEVLPLLTELVHAGSLVVDDIEDGSAERRGRPALHRMYGLPLALNTGNWMYFWPLALLPTLGLPEERELALGRRFHQAMLRCHHGQALDLALRITDLGQEEVRTVVEAAGRLKTGSLTELAAAAGAITAGASEERIAAIARFGAELGLGLQMLDDLGNLTGRREPDKRFEDLRNGRPTWAWAWVAERCDPFSFAQLMARARAVAEGRGDIAALGAILLDRLGGAGRAAAHAHLEAALAALETAVGPAPALGALAGQIRRLEASYG